MAGRGGSPSVSSLRFYSVAVRCPLWQKWIMRKEEGRYERDEDAVGKKGREENSEERKE